MSTLKALDVRLTLAYVLAPLATVPVLAAVGALITSRNEALGDAIAGAVHASFFFAFFGLPVAYIVETLIVWTLRACDVDPARVPWRRVVIWSTLSGALVFPLVWHVIWSGTLLGALAAAPVGALMGGASGATFVIIRGRPASSAVAI